MQIGLYLALGKEKVLVITGSGDLCLTEKIKGVSASTYIPSAGLAEFHG